MAYYNLFIVKSFQAVAQKSFIVLVIYRSSHRRCSVRKIVLRNFAKFTGKHLCQSLFFNKVAGLGHNYPILTKLLFCS